MAILHQIAIYPLKSFDPVQVEQARVLPNGALEHDRQFALVDSAGKFINAKRTASVHRVAVTVDPITRTLSVGHRDGGMAKQFDMDAHRPGLEAWFTEYFGLPVTLIEEPDGGFPDDTEATGPTIVSTASLETVAEWFPGLTLDNVRLRFRGNIEIAGVESFWEDQLYGAASSGDRPFRIGSVTFGGSNPCQRCVVPTRDPASGTVYPGFARRLSEQREATLPAWANRDRFDHFYRMTVNTRVINPGTGIIQVGDPVELAP